MDLLKGNGIKHQSCRQLSYRLIFFKAVTIFLIFSTLTFSGSSCAGAESDFTKVLDRNVLEICVSPRDGLGFAIIRDYEGWSPYTSLYRTKDYGKTWEKIKIMVRENEYFYRHINDDMFLTGISIKTNGEVFVTAYNTRNMANRFPLVKYGQRRIFGSWNQGEYWWIDEEFDGDSDYIYINQRYNRSKLTKNIGETLYVSKDNGKTLDRTNIFLNSTVLDGNIWIDSRVAVNGTTIVVTDPNLSQQVFISTDGGYKWTRTIITGASYQSKVVGVDIAYNGYIFAGTRDGNVFMSKDTGQTWEKFGELGELYDIGVCEEKESIVVLAATKFGLKRAVYIPGSLITDTTAREGGKTVTTVTADKNKLEEMLRKEGENAVLTIPVNTNADKVVVELTGQMIKNMERKLAVIEIKNEIASYTLPARQINIDAVSGQFGGNVELRNIKVRIAISKSSGEVVKILEDRAKSGEYRIVAPPVDFSVTCAYGDKTVEVKKFSGYVEKTIAIPAGVDPEKITTGVIIDSNGTVSHIPSKKVFIDGKYHIRIKSLNNSAYSLIYYPKAFKDVEKHWAKSYINEMGSRLIIAGIDKNSYAPNREISRAELVVMVVKALGIMESGISKAFYSEWFTGAFNAAGEYGIVRSYGDGAFIPGKAITREEAMELIARAMRIAGIDTEISDTDVNRQLAHFKDRDGFSGMAAKKSAAICVKYGLAVGGNGMIKPKDNITRGEAATMVMKMLWRAGLV